MKIEKVHSDSRGETHSLTSELLTNCEEVAYFYTRKGISRGGCIHPSSREHLCVINGEIQYVYGDDMQKITLYEGDSFTIEANVPHYFTSITDSLVMEWGCPLSDKKTHHPYFRSVVEALNNVQSI